MMVATIAVSVLAGLRCAALCPTPAIQKQLPKSMSSSSDGTFLHGLHIENRLRMIFVETMNSAAELQGF